MTPDEIQVFNKSLVEDIVKVQADVGDLISRCTSALGSTDSLSVLQKKNIDEAQKKTIGGHIKEVEKLMKIAKAMRDEVKKLAQAKPEKYFDMKALLDAHTAFFKAAEQFRDQAPPFRLSLTVNQMPFYRGALNNVHMKVISDKIELVLKHYQEMLVAYRKYKPYGPFKK